MEEKSGVLTPFEKGLIIGMKMAECSVQFIQNELKQVEVNICDKTIYNVWNKWQTQKTYENDYLGNCGRPKVLSKESEEQLIQFVGANPTVSWKQLEDNQIANPQQVSQQTLVRTLNDNGFQQIVRPKKIFMSEENANVRLKWCKNMSLHGKRILDNAIYSDESWVYYSHVHKQYYWTKDDQEIEYENSQIKYKWPKKVMIWASIHRSGPLSLYFIEGNMNQHQYLDILSDFFIENNFLTYTQDSYFQQDNSTCHKTAIIDNFFSKNKINVLQWPPNSPDISPIESVWFTLKNIINQQIDEIDSFEQFKSIIQQTFLKNKKVKDSIQNSIRKVPTILEGIIKRKGYPQ